MKKFLFLVFIFLFLYVGGRYYFATTRPNSDSIARVSFAIPSGSSVKKIASILEKNELIRDALSFEWFARINGVSDKMQAGEYILLRNLTFSEVVEALQNGKSKEIKVTIPEGSTIAQIDQILGKRSLVSLGDFKKCTDFCVLNVDHEGSLEGFLYPSTYYVAPKTFSAKGFIQRLYRNFQAQIAPFASQIKASGRTVLQVVKVASMIEREAFGDSYQEKQKIADVIWKRLDERIHLGIDATTRYEKNDWKGPLYAEDFAKVTPYNTRKNYGLPPTAIANPGLDSLKAAIFPEKNKYYYYLHDSTGKIHFSVDLAGHNKNKSRYLR